MIQGKAAGGLPWCFWLLSDRQCASQGANGAGTPQELVLHGPWLVSPSCWGWVCRQGCKRAYWRCTSWVIYPGNEWLHVSPVTWPRAAFPCGLLASLPLRFPGLWSDRTHGPAGGCQRRPRRSHEAVHVLRPGAVCLRGGTKGPTSLGPVLLYTGAGLWWRGRLEVDEALVWWW